MRRLLVLLAFLSAAPMAQAAWPDRPVRIVVPIAPGGSNDFVARLLGQELSTKLGQPVVVENRPGASGQIGMRSVAQAEPDGYTLILANSGAVAITPALQNAGYDANRDFTPVGMVMSMPIMLVVRNELPVKNVGELVSLMQRDPIAVTFGSPGAGQTPHMATELLLRSVGADKTVIASYRGAGPAANDLVAGVTQALFDTSATLQMSKAGKLRILAVTGRERSTLMPEVPTLGESGIANMELSSWFALLAPAGTPADVVEKLNTLLREALAKPEIVASLSTINAEPRITTVAETQKEIAHETQFWRDTVKLLTPAQP